MLLKAHRRRPHRFRPHRISPHRFRPQPPLPHPHAATTPQTMSHRHVVMCPFVSECSFCSFWSHVKKLAPSFVVSCQKKLLCLYTNFSTLDSWLLLLSCLAVVGGAMDHDSMSWLMEQLMPFFGSKNLASFLGVLPSNDRNLVAFSGACGHRTTLKSGCENQYSKDAAPLGVAFTMRAHDA